MPAGEGAQRLLLGEGLRGIQAAQASVRSRWCIVRAKHLRLHAATVHVLPGWEEATFRDGALCVASGTRETAVWRSDSTLPWQRHADQ